MPNPATITRIADAVVDRLNDPDNGLPIAPLASRAYIPRHELKELPSLRVTVVPAELSMVPLNRNSHDFDYAVDLGIQQKVSGGDEPSIDEVDELMAFVEDVVDLFRGKRLAALEIARCVEASNAPIFDPDHLSELSVMTSVVRLVFRVARTMT
jgi:hypothetical protein